MTTLAAVAESPTELSANTIRTIVLPQRFDVHEVAQFEIEIARTITPGTVLVIDASAVRYMDRTGMDSLITARLHCMDLGGDLQLAAASVAARVILELSGRYEALNPVDQTDRQDLASLIAVAA